MTSTPTRGQAERSLSQRIQALYRGQLEHQPSRVTCQILVDKLVIVIEDSITQPEQILAEEGQTELVEQIRSSLSAAIEPQLKALVEEVLGVTVTDVLSDAKLESGRTGLIMLLSTAPQLRPSPARAAV
jgi:uncharacterized protein YbcI